MVRGFDRDTEAAGIARTRDAAQTREQLLDAARIRFARDGYTATTVRDIATDVGVNVALINRYFDSKEGLFEACIFRVEEELGDPGATRATLDGLIQGLLTQVAGPAGTRAPVQLLLLLRTSGDEKADEVRRRVLRSFAERIARVAGWQPGDDALLLRAELVMGAAVGWLYLRSGSGLEPLNSATADDLTEPLRDMIRALLTDAAARG